jgi:hypothetical protein
VHPAAYQFVADALAAYPLRPGLTVELGGRNVNGSIRGLFPSPYLAVDIRPGVGVDVVADGASWLPPAPAVRVVCCEVLEHTAAAPVLVHQAWRMLDWQGVAYITAAAPSRAPHSALDGGPVRKGEYYRGVSAEMLVAWLTPFERHAVVEDPDAGDVYAIAWK